MKKSTSTYSQIIEPEKYIEIMSRQHLYISKSDSIIKEIIESEIKNIDIRFLEVVEIGCGPARIIPLMAPIPKINLYGIDHDKKFIDYAKKKVITDIPAKIIYDDIINYNHPKPVDIFYSQGFHHHVPKNESLILYLRNIYNQLKHNGLYIVSDEFLPDYFNEEERNIKAIVWYSHIISDAKKNHYDFLAIEETKTLLDDLSPKSSSQNIKTPAQINWILSVVDKLDLVAMLGDLHKAEELAQDVLYKFYNMKKENLSPVKNPSYDLSRGDYKTSGAKFIKEVTSVGFKVEKHLRVGPGIDIGGMEIFLLRKPHYNNPKEKRKSDY